MPTSTETGSAESASKANESMRDAAKSLAAAEEHLNGVKDAGPTVKNALAALRSARKAVQRAATRVAAVAALVTGMALTGPAAEASLPNSPSVPQVETTVDDGPAAVVIEGTADAWTVAEREDWIEGLTGIVASTAVENRRTTSTLTIACEAGTSKPIVAVGLSSPLDALPPNAPRDTTLTTRIRFGEGQAFDQTFRVSSDNKTLEVSNDADHAGLGASEMARELAAADTLRAQFLVVLPDGERGTEQYEFDTSSPELSRAVDRMDEVCGMANKNELAATVTRGGDSQPTPSQENPERNAAWGVPSQECNRGLFSREAERVTGALVGAGLGVWAANSTGEDSNKGRVMGGVLGALLGAKAGSSVGKRLEDRRAEGQVGDARHYAVAGDAKIKTLSFQTLRSGDVCVTSSDHEGEEVSTRRFDAEKGARMEQSLMDAMARSQAATRRAGFGR